jgi:mannose-6-phosphate isomerase
MTLERTFTRNVSKPWGRTDLRPWNEHYGEGPAIGEVWFQRSDQNAREPALLLKILFTSEPLSIQVHPSDAYAQSIGLVHGKCEAWYVLSARPDARIALGLKRRVSPSELRAAIETGSIAELVRWRGVKSGEAILVSAGTIHAMGPGMVVVEIQQRSEATFRLFDYGRGRELHTDDAAAAASGGPAARQAPLRKLTKERMLLVADQHFMLERVELPPGSNWELVAPRETWLFVLEGRASVGALDVCRSEAIFLEADSARIRVRSTGLQGLVAYVGADPNPSLLRALKGEGGAAIANSNQAQSFPQSEVMSTLTFRESRA